MNKSSIISELRQTQAELAEHIQALSVEAFNQVTGESWSAAGYLKHLLLSNKPFAKGLTQPKERLAGLFGTCEAGSRSYEDVVALYQARLAEGIKAENFEAVTPDYYRLPDGISDEKAYFVQTWNETHEKLYAALENWEESDLDLYQLPHPAIGKITIREMLYFTISHNRLHYNDIRALAHS